MSNNETIPRVGIAQCGEYCLLWVEPSILEPEIYDLIDGRNQAKYTCLIADKTGEEVNATLVIYDDLRRDYRQLNQVEKQDIIGERLKFLKELMPNLRYDDALSKKAARIGKGILAESLK